MESEASRKTARTGRFRPPPRARFGRPFSPIPFRLPSRISAPQATASFRLAWERKTLPRRRLSARQDRTAKRRTARRAPPSRVHFPRNKKRPRSRGRAFPANGDSMRPHFSGAAKSQRASRERGFDETAFLWSRQIAARFPRTGIRQGQTSLKGRRGNALPPSPERFLFPNPHPFRFKTRGQSRSCSSRHS